MKKFGFVTIGLVVAAAGLVGWRFVRTRRGPSIGTPSAQVAATQTASPQPQSPAQQVSAANAPAQAPLPSASVSESPKHFGPFSIAAQSYTVDLETKHVQSSDENGDTVTAMEIRDAAGTVQYRRTFATAEEQDFFESWSVSALALTGTNGTGLLVNYDVYSEPSAPEEESSSWFQVFGVLEGKLIPFGAPLEVQGGLLDQYSDGKTYKAARPLGTQADAFEFKVWTGHCRMVFPVRVDWAQGKLSSAQECVKTPGELGAGCQYRLLPEDKLYSSADITFVRLWPGPDEKSGQPVKAVMKKTSKVDLLLASVPTQWTEGKTGAAAASSKGPSEDAGGFGVAADSDLWLKVRIDGKEGWMHSEEDFRALGLPEDE
jgi:hypothetical protein